MTDRSPEPGSMSRRVLGLIRRLPAPVQVFAYRAIEDFAFFLVVILALPVLVIVFIVATGIVGLLYWVLGSPTGPIGAVIAYAWLASWTILPIIITVRMWRSVPVLRRLARLATDGLDAEPGAAGAILDVPNPSTFVERIAAADASIGSGTADPATGDGPRAAGPTS